MIGIFIIAFGSTFIAGVGVGLSFGFVLGRDDTTKGFLIEHKERMKEKIQ